MIRSTSEDTEEATDRDEVLALLREKVDVALALRDDLLDWANDPPMWDADRAVFASAADLQSQVASALEDRLRVRSASR